MPDVPPLKLTRGAWRLLEDTVRHYAEGRTLPQLARLCTLWDRIRSANKFIYLANGEEILDNEYQDWLNASYPNATEHGADVPERLRHNGLFNRSWNKWLDEELELQLSPRQHELSKEYLRKRQKEGKTSEVERGKATLPPLPVNMHSLKLLQAFGLDEDDVD